MWALKSLLISFFIAVCNCNEEMENGNWACSNNYCVSTNGGSCNNSPNFNGGDTLCRNSGYGNSARVQSNGDQLEIKALIKSAKSDYAWIGCYMATNNDARWKGVQGAGTCNAALNSPWHWMEAINNKEWNGGCVKVGKSQGKWWAVPPGYCSNQCRDVICDKSANRWSDANGGGDLQVRQPGVDDGAFQLYYLYDLITSSGGFAVAEYMALAVSVLLCLCLLLTIVALCKATFGDRAASRRMQMAGIHEKLQYETVVTEDQNHVDEQV